MASSNQRYSAEVFTFTIEDFSGLQGKITIPGFTMFLGYPRSCMAERIKELLRIKVGLHAPAHCKVHLWDMTSQHILSRVVDVTAVNPSYSIFATTHEECSKIANLYGDQLIVQFEFLTDTKCTLSNDSTKSIDVVFELKDYTNLLIQAQKEKERKRMLQEAKKANNGLGNLMN
ncbi:hypothetical protein CEXT_536721 [Caerostris extrusa]|uniref:Uncharacterized protein n=1 Tax=Caerostris extrusa TaxID=172846 RepID=A0AAV4Q725_CAEEX|nr:hypothetical protein CEXT_536721 [Caerostris extrusa]